MDITRGLGWFDRASNLLSFTPTNQPWHSSCLNSVLNDRRFQTHTHTRKNPCSTTLSLSLFLAQHTCLSLIQPFAHAVKAQIYSREEHQSSWTFYLQFRQIGRGVEGSVRQGRQLVFIKLSAHSLSTIKHTSVSMSSNSCLFFSLSLFSLLFRNMSGSFSPNHGQIHRSITHLCPCRSRYAKRIFTYICVRVSATRALPCDGKCQHPFQGVYLQVVQACHGV